MIIISIIITILYLLLIGSFAFGFDKVNYLEVSPQGIYRKNIKNSKQASEHSNLDYRVKLFKLENSPSKTKFSVIVPFRNEAENLPNLIKTIQLLQYPRALFEIIFVDDASEDLSVKTIKDLLKSSDCDQPDTSIIHSERKTNSPKKDAISTAIKHAKYEWIITTDADCVLPSCWLDSFDEYIQKTQANCIAAPVTYLEKSHFLNRFQLLDMLSLQGATMGGFGIKKPFLCNGANFAYKKELFNELNGFEGNTNIASGDDIFLLEKAAKKYPKQLGYLKCDHAIVKTQAQPTWETLVSQRVRWAAKTSTYNSWFGKGTGLIVLLMNLLIITLPILTIFNIFNLNIFIYLVIIKFNIDFFLIYKSAAFFNQKGVLKSFIVGFLVYPFFSVYVAFISLFSSYKWKGRTFKK
jgi:cellulose synthase/poly-beta-1,6-N-acetylglucosamine synthase-like glycosyltransferase